MTRTVIYTCNVCGATGTATIVKQGHEGTPNPDAPGQSWADVNSEHMMGVFHVCSDACFARWLATHPGEGWYQAYGVRYVEARYVEYHREERTP